MAFKLTHKPGKWIESETHFFEDEFATGELTLVRSGNAQFFSAADAVSFK
jgi:hypothetical protein